MKTKILIGAILAIVLAAGGLWGWNTYGTEAQVEKKLDLAVKYLSDNNYEQAILAFNDVIRIDPKNVRAYLGLADAYVGTGDMDKAITALTKGLELTGDDSIRAKLEELNTRKNIISLLVPLYQALAGGDLEAASSLMRTEPYIAQSRSAVYEEPYYYGKTTGGNTRQGMGLGSYPNNYYYYGNWEKGVRSGKGLWICLVPGDDSPFISYTYEGSWENDLPNGEGTIISKSSRDKIEAHKNYTNALQTKIVGTFLNGMEHGNIYQTWYMDNGEVMVWSPITAVKGVYQPLAYVPQYAEPEPPAGQYYVAVANDGSDLTWPGRVNAVEGLQIKE